MEWLVAKGLLDWIIGGGIALAVLLVFALFRCIGKAACAKRLGLNCGWMAFMPFLNAYLDGRLAEASDVQRFPLSEKRPKWGKRNLVLRILCVIFGFLFLVAVCVFAITLGLTFAHKLSNLKINGIVGLVSTIIGFITNAAAYFQDMNTATVITEFRVVYIICGVLMIAALVIFTVALIRALRLMFKTYSALSPKSAGGLLVLSFFIPLSMSVIFMVLGFSRTPVEKATAAERKAQRAEGRRKDREILKKNKELMKLNRQNRKKKAAEESSVITLPPPAEDNGEGPEAGPAEEEEKEA